jgi:hypothetical protein
MCIKHKHLINLLVLIYTAYFVRFCVISFLKEKEDVLNNENIDELDGRFRECCHASQKPKVKPAENLEGLEG